jgi:RNA polymerase sigma factor (sigma-70 family)
MGRGVEPPPHLFEQLLRQVGKTRQLARSLLGDESAAEDAIQETWASVSRRPPPETPEPWLRTAVRNRLLNRAREEKRRAAREEQAPPGPEPASPEELLARLEMHKKLVEAVARLPEPYRQTILLRYFEELSSVDIGARLAVPAATVRGRLKTAIDLLREDLDRAPGGRKAWVGAMLLLAGGARMGPQAASAAASAAAGGSAFTVKLVVGLLLACGAGAAMVVSATRPAAPPVARPAPAPPARLQPFALRAPAPSTSPAQGAPEPAVAGAPGAAPGTPTATGVATDFGITGWVALGETRPQPARLAVTDPSCPPGRDELVLANYDGSLENVVVRVVTTAPPAGPPPAAPLVIEQRDCRYRPRIAVARSGQTIQLRSADQVLHRAHGYAGKETVGTGPLSLGTPPVELAGPRAGETVRLGCDLHPWMTATVLGTDNPWYAVTDRGGRFTVRGLPAGTHTIEAWHEHYGAQRTQVTLGPGRPMAVLNFVFGKEWQPAAGESNGKGWPFPADGKCHLAVKGDSEVAIACREGGVKKAKATMKTLVKLGKARGLKFECDGCHRDGEAGNWTLQDGARESFKKLLAAVRDGRDSRARP